MLESDYKDLSKRHMPKKKFRTKSLPKATEKYLEAEEILKQQLDEHRIAYIAKYQFKKTKHWRFDFLIVRKRILIEIAGSSWSVGHGGRNVANDFNKYDHAEDMGFRCIRLEPREILDGVAFESFINLLNK